MIKFGCCGRIALIEDIAKAGYDYIELSATEVASLDDSGFSQLVERLENAHIKCLAMNDYSQESPAVVGDQCDDSITRAYAEHILARAAVLGTTNLGIGSPLGRRLPEGYDRQLADLQAVQFLRVTGDVAANYPGMIIEMESLNANMCNFCNSQPHSIQLVKSAERENVKVEADFFHMYMCNESFDVFDSISPIVGHIHISGCSPEGGRRMLEDGDEKIYESASKVILRNNYSGLMSVEVPQSAFSYEKAVEVLNIFKKYLG